MLVNCRVNPNLINAIDDYVKSNDSTRSHFIRRAISERLAFLTKQKVEMTWDASLAKRKQDQFFITQR